ncbi:hypothetical protein H5410_052073 [Solanum commersonii]|uniref:R13L1/DRL21-like LRR repeat region domain-containing protein n=1 Tax=Solanum commersonii TaxID=4109 RepID=A0A9J5X2K6_SOLCO|nr:hypothetical protein H5410_052073 [Solanum commersonii]
MVYLRSHDESEGCEINDEHVLDGLQPHPNLKTLEVENYLGTKFPSWFNEELLPNFVILKLNGSKCCEEIPSHLELVGFHELECIGPPLYGVEISNSGSSCNNDIIQVFRSLKELVLDIDNEMPLLSLCNNLTSLVNLVVELREFPQSLYKLHSIKSLKFTKWNARAMTVSSDFDKCPKLISIPAGSLHDLTGLRHLEIVPLSKMVDFEAFQLIFIGIQQMFSLHCLCVVGRLH